MKKIILFLTFLSFVAAAQNQPVSFKKNDAEKKIDVIRFKDQAKGKIRRKHR
jgi:hypothetical protein